MKTYRCLVKAAPGSLAAIILITSSQVYAQLLEEIVVTAQRREQSLQDVPITLEVFSGEQVLNQGLGDVSDLSSMSPTLSVDPSGHSGGIRMRGVGTEGANLSFEMAVPIFVDGVHFGRRAQNRAAFLDVERIETMRGPQPVFFGQNASAGAISIISRGPTPEWEGRLITEVGNNGILKGEFGVGGPITDTLGIRLAGKYDYTNGYLRDIITRDPFPERRSLAGRVLLDWKPTERFGASFKFEYVDVDHGPEGRQFFLQGEPAPGNEPNPVRDGVANIYYGLEGVNHLPLRQGISRDGIAGGPAWLAPPEQLQRPGGGGRDVHVFFNPMGVINSLPHMVDITESNQYIYPGMTGLTQYHSVVGPDFFTGFEIIRPWNTYLKLNYELPNGMLLESQTAHAEMKRNLLRHPGAGFPFPGNPMPRSEDFKQWSQEFRLSSAPDSPFEWMAMMFWQEHTNDHKIVSVRLNQQRQILGNISSDDATWLSAAGAVTFDFLDERFSLDLGARYTDVSKEGSARNIAGHWILEDPGVADPAIIDRPAPGQVVVERGTRSLDPDIWHGARILGYTTPIIVDNPNRRNVLGDPDAQAGLRGEYSTSSFDPQVVLRYRPSASVSVYARYAQAFKAGGFDTAVTGIAQNVSEFTFEDEHVDSIELGVRGNFLVGRGNYDLTLSETNYKDLQMSSPDPGSVPEGRNVTRNAAHQRVRALEFGGRVALTDQLRVGIMGALMDGVMVEFEHAVCTDAEFEAGTTTDPDAVGICRVLGPSGSEWTSIDRSGQDALHTPDWSFTLSLDYRHPVLDGYEVTFNSQANISDGYVSSFQDENPWPQHENVNLNLGYGDRDGTWRITGFVRNVFETLPTYDPVADLDPDGLGSATMIAPSNFRRYGLQFRYNY